MPLSSSTILLLLLLFCCFLLLFFKMPKAGLAEREWRKRLEAFSQRKFRFGRGQRPPKGSKWAIRLERVEKCPLHLHPDQQFDALGRPMTCSCGYHKPPAVSQ